MNKRLVPAPLRILIVDDEANIRTTLSLCLEAEGHWVIAHSNIQDALEEVARQVFDLVFLDVRLGMDNGLDFLPQLRAESPWAKVVIITAYVSVETAIEAMKRGASDYLAKPFDARQVQSLTQKVAERRELERQVETLQAAIGSMDVESNFETNIPAMREALDIARQVAPSKSTLLIRGEAGTGKSALARAIHAWGSRPSGPYSAVSCQQEADELEAELFGVSPGHAIAARPQGKVCLCDTGTLVLSEVGQIPPRLQVKLLHLIREHQYERMDETQPRAVDIRIIATTTEDLSRAVAKGTFRPDLLLALDVVQIALPALRERREDILPLAERYLGYFAKENARSIVGFSSDATYALKNCVWTGNTRELRNVIERAVLLCKSDRIEVQHFPPNLLNAVPSYSIGDLVPLETIRNIHVQKVLDSTRSIRRAAAVLGVDSSTLCRWLKRDGASGDQPAA